jgi:hypothetical protein
MPCILSMMAAGLLERALEGTLKQNGAPAHFE